MTDRTTELETVLAEVCRAAAIQLQGMGRGKEPSPRLQEAFDAASALLGRDATNDPNDRLSALAIENARLRAELGL